MERRHTTLGRREFLKLAGGAAASLALPRAARGGRAGGGAANVLFIAVDDLNDWVGCCGGHPDARTPRIDRLARRGVVFANAQCPAPLCNASRASLLTGVRPSTSGVYTNRQPFRAVLPRVVTLPQHFMNHGYRVVGGGKIYHGGFPDPASWHEYFPTKTRTRPADPMPPKRPLNGIRPATHFDWGPVDVKDEAMGDWKVARWAADELAKKHDRPLFLAVGIFRPHLPWYVPGKYFEMFSPEKVTLPKVKKDDLSDVPAMGRKIAAARGDHAKVLATNNWHKAVAGYLASMAFADACVGQVLDALRAGPNAKDTVVVLWGDHGWHLGEKLHWRKFALWEEACRCPLIVAAPGVTTPGGVCTRPVGLIDLYPTLAELCGLPPAKGQEGLSLVPLLTDPAAARDRPGLTTFGRGNHSVRTERWRYIRYRDGSEELYDHASDEMEWTNLAREARHEPVKKDLARWLPKVNAQDAPTARRKARQQR